MKVADMSNVVHVMDLRRGGGIDKSHRRVSTMSHVSPRRVRAASRGVAISSRAAVRCVLRNGGNEDNQVQLR